LEAIWSREAHNPDGDERSRVRALYEERNDRVRALLSPEQQAQFDTIHQECDAKREAIFDERRKHFDAAVEKTKAILDPGQREKYEAIIAGMEKRDGDRPPDGSRMPKHP